jgi:pimeloyl-ACP methyl ester carboxylesterase
MLATLDRPEGALAYEVIDLAAPWARDPGLIVFHHGVGATAEIWAEWLPELVDRHRVARFDTRGFGRSAVPPAGFGWSLEGLAADVLAVARAAGAERFHLVGESLGGTVGLHLAAHHPEALLSLTVSNASHRGGAIQRAREWRAFIEARGMVAWAETMTPLRLDRAQAGEARWRWFEAVQAQAAASTVLDLADLLLGTDLTAALDAIRIPVLLLAPGQSPFVPLAVMEEMHRRIAGSELRVFADARHGLPCSHGRAGARVLRDFLARRTPGLARGAGSARDGR